MLTRAVALGARARSKGGGLDVRSTRARRWLIGLVVAAFAATLVVIDLPTRATSSYKAATLKGYLTTLRGDVAPCEAGVHDALQAAIATLKASSDIQPGVASTFAAQGVAACSFTNNSTVNLASMAPPHSLTSRAVAELAPAFGALVYTDAFPLLQDLARVLRQPHAAAPRAQFALALDRFERERGTIGRLINTARRSEGLGATSIRLFSPRAMLPDGRLPAAARR